MQPIRSGALNLHAPAATTNPEMTIAQACWHGPSHTMVRGLQTAGIAVVGVAENTAAYRANAFEHPGIMRRVAPDGQLTAGPVQTLDKLKIPSAINHAVSPSDKAAAAVMQDDAAALRASWDKLTAAERTATLCCAAAVGGEHVARFCIPRLWGRLDRPDAQPAGNTPLHYAALAGYDNVAMLLLRGGARPNPRNPVETQPMHDAARSGSVAVLRLLHRAGADLAKTNVYGDTVLHRIAEFSQENQSGNYLAAYHFCIARYASKEGDGSATDFVNATNKKGFNALDMAKVRGQTALCQALLKDGAHHSLQWHATAAENLTYEKLNHDETWEAICAQLEKGQQAA